MEDIEFISKIIRKFTEKHWYSLPDVKYWYKGIAEDLYQLNFWAGTKETRLHNINNIQKDISKLSSIISKKEQEKLKNILKELKEYYENDK